MCFKNKMIVMAFCAIVAVFGLATANIAKATASTTTPSASLSGLTIDQLQLIIANLKQQIAILIQILEKRNPVAVCGNGDCQSTKGETSITCPADCVPETSSTDIQTNCSADSDCMGDSGTCHKCFNKSWWTTQSDSAKAAVKCWGIGNSICTCQSGTCAIASICGDGTCNTNENTDNCAADCSAKVACTPTTCNELGYECGSADNGCNAILECGDCAAGKTCAAGKCVAPTTAAAGKRCVNVLTCKTSTGSWNSTTQVYDNYCDGTYTGYSTLTEKAQITQNNNGTFTICMVDLNSETTVPASTVTAAKVCGNGKCETGETRLNCPRDCLSSCLATGNACSSGSGLDTRCCSGNTCKTVDANSAGICVKSNTCGNGICEPLYDGNMKYIGETAANCAADCGQCITVTNCGSPNFNFATNEIMCNGTSTGKKYACAGATSINCGLGDQSGICNYCCAH